VVALASFPHMAPQIASLITGLEPDDPQFREGQQALVEHLVRALTPRAPDEASDELLTNS
jgi:hypothetical protein